MTNRRLSHLIGPGPLDSASVLDLCALLGDDWHGFTIRHTADGWTFFNPQWRRGFTAGELKQHFYVVQGLARERLALEQARRDLEAEISRADAAESRAYFYRRQLALESSAGAMLARIFTTPPKGSPCAL